MLTKCTMLHFKNPNVLEVLLALSFTCVLASKIVFTQFRSFVDVHFNYYSMINIFLNYTCIMPAAHSLYYKFISSLMDISLIFICEYFEVLWICMLGISGRYSL